MDAGILEMLLKPSLQEAPLNLYASLWDDVINSAYQLHREDDTFFWLIILI